MRLAIRFFLALSLVAGSIMADTIFSTFGPGDSFDTISDGNHSYDVGGGAFNSNIEDQQASSFVPTESFVLDSIRVGAFNFEGSNQLTVYIAAGATEPGAPIESFSVTGIPSTATILTFDSTLHPLLDDGTRYWVVLTKDDLAGGADEWSLNTAGFLGRSFMLFQNGVWHDRPTAVAPAFDVSGTVPEPSSIALLFTALAALAFARRRVLH
jgi:PEP-CTERM motif